MTSPTSALGRLGDFGGKVLVLEDDRRYVVVDSLMCIYIFMHTYYAYYVCTYTYLRPYTYNTIRISGA